MTIAAESPVVTLAGEPRQGWLSQHIGTAAVGAVGGYLFGHWVGNVIASNYPTVNGSAANGANDVAVVLGLSIGVFGWLLGIGALNYPLAKLIGREPLARVAAAAAHGVDPDVFGIAPVEAANVALARAGIGWGDVAAVELNEAFASQSLACLAGWPELDPELVNVRGGAIAIGHPLGASGTRVLGRLAHELHARGGGYGVAAICIGVGQGLAVILEA